VSHSRPHRVKDSNNFDVATELLRAARRIAAVLAEGPVVRPAVVSVGDARSLTEVADGTIDAVITSPPYLNAIDYMRGHRLSLVWLGYSILQLREIRATSIGSEKGPDAGTSLPQLSDRVAELPWFKILPGRQAAVVRRYSADVCALMSEVHRVLRRAGKAVLVIGNSCLRGVYIENSRILELAAEVIGLRCTGVYTRDLPEARRYLPTPGLLSAADLAKRMRKECVLTFVKA
jgi:DNA modification methylase